MWSLDGAQAGAPGLRTGWQGALCAGGTCADPARGISAPWAKQNIRGKTTLQEMPWFHWELSLGEFRGTKHPSAQERQPCLPVAAASVLSPAILRLFCAPGSPLASGFSLSLFTSSSLPGQPSCSPQGIELHAEPRSGHKQRHQPQPLHSVHLPRQLPVPFGSKMGSAYLYACRDWEVGDFCVCAHRLRFCFPRGTWLGCAHRVWWHGLWKFAIRPRTGAA